MHDFRLGPIRRKQMSFMYSSSLDFRIHSGTGHVGPFIMIDVSGRCLMNYDAMQRTPSLMISAQGARADAEH